MSLSERVDVLIEVLDPDLGAPLIAHSGDAAVDLCSREDLDLAPGERSVVGTGIAIALPPGHAAFIHPRSGLALKFGLTMVNAPGTIDAGYRGEIKVILLNTDTTTPFRISRGDRIAQMVIQRVVEPVFHEVQTLPGSHRGEGGFGSTGVSSRAE